MNSLSSLVLSFPNISCMEEHLNKIIEYLFKFEGNIFVIVFNKI